MKENMVTRPRVELTVAEATFEDWLNRSLPGDRYVYYVGQLAEARGLRETGGAAVPDVCNHVWKLAYDEVGYPGHPHITLVQRRSSPEGFDYIAVRLAKPIGLPLSPPGYRPVEVRPRGRSAHYTHIEY